MDTQRLAIKGSVLALDDPRLQDALAAVYETQERPRCLCVAGGIEMYVARHRQYVVKRMPETGKQHHPGCTSYEPDPQESGLGELMGEAVLNREAGKVELRVDFPWTRSFGGGVVRSEPREVAEVGVAQRRMSLRALTHYLFERAGLNRWSPAMEGKRNQGVLHKYLSGAAEDVTVKGVTLAERLYVPEPFHDAARTEIAERRRRHFAVMLPQDGARPLGLVMGEYKSNERTSGGQRLWVRHLPDTPLLVTSNTWQRLERLFAPLFEARDADTGYPVRLLLTALIRTRREHTYEVDAASLMLATAHWIPLEGVFELPLIHTLVEQGRRFIKPLRYDAPAARAFPNALLLDAGATPVRLQVVSPFMPPKQRQAKESAIARAGENAWSWMTADDLPDLPAKVRR